MRWEEYGADDVRERYVSHSAHAGQEGPCFVEGLGGRGQVEGLDGVVRLLVAKAPFVLELLLGL